MGIILTIVIIFASLFYQNCSKSSTATDNKEQLLSKSEFQIKSQFCGNPYSSAVDSKGNVFVIGIGNPQSRINPFQSCNSKRILRKSNDGGNTWTDIDFPVDPYSSGLIIDNNDNLYVLAGPSIMKSTDGGETWNGSGNIIYNGANVNGSKLAIAANGDFYVYGQYNQPAQFGGGTYSVAGIFKRGNGSNAWILADSIYGNIFDIIIDQNGNVYWSGCSSNMGYLPPCKVRKSTDNGSNWSDLWQGSYEPSGGIASDNKGNTFIGLNYLSNSSNKIGGILMLPSNTNIVINSENKIKILKISSDDSLNIITATPTEWSLHKTLDYTSLTEIAKFTGSPVTAEIDSDGNLFVFDQLDSSYGAEWVTRVLGK